MTIRQGRRFAAPSCAHSHAADERCQREFELNEALKAARALQARLELLGDRAADVAIVRSMRDSLARDLASLSEENNVTLKRFLKEKEHTECR